MKSTPRIKICCIKSKKEARMAFSYGADAIGLVSEVSSFTGVLSENQIREITQIIPPSIDGFVLTRLTDSWDLIDLIRNVKNRTIQLVDKLGIGNYLEIRSSIPCVKIVQVINVRGEESIEEAMKVDPFVDAILLDSGIPDKDISESQGTGYIHDWSICRQIVELVETPVFLSGGLNTDNIVEAIQTVKPFGVDVCMGVRTDDKLDPDKLHDFISKVKNIRL